MALALVEERDWLDAQRLLPKVAAIAGVMEEEILARWVERDLLLTWLDGAFSAADLVAAGYRVWATLLDLDRAVMRNFEIYNGLGDLADLHLGQWDLQLLPEATVRAYILPKLVEDGAFERAGLQAPAS